MSQRPMAQFGHQWSWETGACDPCGRCNCQDCCVCVKTCFCPCIVYGDNTAIVENKQDSCGDCCCYFFLSLFCLECCVAKETRLKIRDMFGLKAEGACGCGDCCTHFCCGRCSLCQETRELNMRMRAGQAGQQGVASPMAPPGQQFMMQKQ